MTDIENEKIEIEKIIEIKNLHTSFFTHIGEVKAVRGISLDVRKGEVLGIVGESGCGKSVSMMSIMGLLASTGKIVDGEVLFGGKDITKSSNKEMQAIRGKEIAMIFQDPMTSLNPLMRIGIQVSEHYIKHFKVSKEEAMNKAIEMLGLVGISNPKERINQYPHEFSGGMRQRVMIAMSLICEPKLLIADEPTTALDVTIQAQILDLLKKIKSELDTAIILITHDLGVVADICQRIAVMYGGMIVETGTDANIFYESRHPYTWGLMKSVPNPESSLRERLKPIEGNPPDLLKPAKGCSFAPRCDYTMEICMQENPPFFEISKGHYSACFLNHKNAPKIESPIIRRKENE